MRGFLIALAAAAVLQTAAQAQVSGQGAGVQGRALMVEIDHAERVQLGSAFSSVIVANPQIADVTVIDTSTLFITGKNYGLTEIVALDAIGRTLFQGQIAVVPSSEGAVRVWRGARVTEMACGRSCAPSLRATAPATP
ncbi:pilus assembly protein N-terminal domain-containing protein [Brevundimonas sp.]|uniref:pilus assembly protein N-terminal domain-containing protein n=1 Tax=Brevundimonas sp. TaxID=1871086 RepID=UPI0022BEC85D|nr:pilus assembly protein N-terminal domain-containing protein [Brevundimonas sp.]MCZ8193252.1 pilus assembly protein N-terminal domain-containing protein [Brevundimonas sp.]